MIPLFLAPEAAYQTTSSFFSEKAGLLRLSVKLTKSSATNLLRPACWIAFAVCTLSTACKQSTQTPPPAPPPVTVATPIRKEVVEWDEYTARTEAVESVEIRPRVSGYIDRISFKDGQLVKPGDIVFCDKVVVSASHPAIEHHQPLLHSLLARDYASHQFIPRLRGSPRS